MCCHTEIEAVDQTFHLIQSQYINRVNHWSANFEVTGMTQPGKVPTAQAGIEPQICCPQGGESLTCNLFLSVAYNCLSRSVPEIHAQACCWDIKQTINNNLYVCVCVCSGSGVSDEARASPNLYGQSCCQHRLCFCY